MPGTRSRKHLNEDIYFYVMNESSRIQDEFLPEDIGNGRSKDRSKEDGGVKENDRDPVN